MSRYRSEVADNGLVTTRRCQRRFDRIRNVPNRHICENYPPNYVAAIVVQDCGQIVPTPADDLEVGKVNLLHLVDCCAFVFELFGGFNDNLFGYRVQISSFENAIS